MHRRTVALALLLLTGLLSAPAGVAWLAAPPPAVPGGSPRLIVELAAPPLADWARAGDPAALSAPEPRLDLARPDVAAHLARLRADQRAFAARLERAAPGAEIARFRDENGRLRPASYQLVFNGLSVEAPRGTDLAALGRTLAALPGVKRVHPDRPHAPDMYASLPLINAAAAWGHPDIGGQANAGRGVKVASMDGGLWVDAAMFDGEGYSYPSGYPLGYLKNTNGKIIVSRAYFRTWDPPSAGDEDPWPGLRGTSHGVHTGATAMGDRVEAPYLGITVTLSGVAPAAYAMSYRVFYNSITNDGSFYDTEGIAALEDIVRDGADVVVNSWGGGPGSVGGPNDALDTALVNAWRAGVFVAMANGNAGPNPGTGDHPSAEYINAAASTTTGSFAAGRGFVTAPEPVSDTLKGFGYTQASFGQPLPVGTLTAEYPFKSALAVDPANAQGCQPWAAGSFTEQAAVIARGGCEFGVKALNAQQAGALLAIIYNTPGNNGSFGMSGGAVGDQVTIPAVSVGHHIGLALASWAQLHGAAARLRFDTKAYQVGNTPDVIADFSSRGPGVGNVLKPDIAAPGVSILSQGFGIGTGLERHLNFGQAGGTSMATPHVAGAAALLRQIHPDWSNAWIKSALMSTAKFCGIRNGNGTPAMPLDMGAGRLDLGRAATPGLILDPPSLSFGQVVTGTRPAIKVMARSVADAAQTYDLATAMNDLGDCQAPVAGLSVEPARLSLAPGESATFTVTWDTAASGGYADRQGYVVLRQNGAVMAQLPAWVRVGYPGPAPAVLVLDNDGSTATAQADYTGFYTRTLAALGASYEVRDVEAGGIPNATVLSRYQTVLVQTGDGRGGPGAGGLNRLVEYANNGGRLLAFGQDLAAAWGSANPSSSSFAYGFTLGGRWLQDSVNGETVYTRTAQLIEGLPGTPLVGLRLDVSARGDGAGNQGSMDEIDRPTLDPDRPAGTLDEFRPLLRYGPAPHRASDGAPFTNGYVAVGHRQNVSLEKPGLTFNGRSLYFSFGLEGVNDDTGFNSRADLLGAALAWLHDTAAVTISVQPAKANDVTLLTAAVTATRGQAGVAYRWDFGDGSAFTPAYPSATVGHRYRRPGTYWVRVEATDDLGTRAIGETRVLIVDEDPHIDSYNRIYLPVLRKD